MIQYDSGLKVRIETQNKKIRNNMKILRQKEFNSKEQKARRRYKDFKIGEERLSKVSPESAEHAYFHGAASYPGENIKSVYREGENWHYKGELRPGVSPEKAKQLEEAAAKQDPKRFFFNKNLISGRERQRGTVGYSEDKSRVNQRINARSLGDSNLKEDLKDPEIRAKV
jgi:hypothetical protein